MTKQKLVNDLAAKSGLTKKQVDTVLGGLADAAKSTLNAEGAFVLPGIAKLTVKTTKALPARTLAGKPVPAKPAGKRIGAKALKPIKDAVCV